MENCNCKITVIMPVYNSGKFLDSAVSSVLSQTLKDIQLILVDDGSTDDSPQKCDLYAKNDSRVFVIHKENGGICSARNAALNFISGKYIAFCDHDDVFELDAFQESFHFAEQNKLDILKFGHNIIRIFNNKIINKKSVVFDEKVFPQKIEDQFLNYTSKKILNDVWDGLYLTSFVKKSQCKFDISYKAGGEDLDFNRQLAIFNPRIGTLNKILYNHYIRLGVSTSSGYKDSAICSAIFWPKRFSSYINSMGKKDITHEPDYIKTALYESVGPLVQGLSRKDCPLTRQEKKRKINELKHSFAMEFNIFDNSILIANKLGFKYGLLFILLKLNLCNCAMNLYKLKKV